MRSLAAVLVALLTALPLVAANGMPPAVPPTCDPNVSTCAESQPCPSGTICTNRDPYARAGPDMSVPEFTAIRLNGTQSYDLDPDSELDFQWRVKRTIPLLGPPQQPGGQPYSVGGVTYLETDAGTTPPTVKMYDPAPAYPAVSVMLQDEDTANPCFIAPYLRPDFGPVLQVVVELWVSDGEDSPPAGSDLEQWSEIDEMVVTVVNTDQPPHGRGDPTAPTCDEPAVLPPIVLDTYLLEQKGAGENTDFDIIENQGQHVLFEVTDTDAYVDDVGVIDAAIVLRRTFTQEEIDAGVAKELPSTLRVDMELIKAMDYVQAGGTPAWGHLSYWPFQKQSTWRAVLPIDHPDIVAAAAGGTVNYEVLVTAYDESGGRVNNSEQDLEVSFGCTLCPEIKHEFELVDGKGLEQPTQLSCLKDVQGKPATGAPQASPYKPVPVGPGSVVRWNVSSFIEKDDAKFYFEPGHLMVRKITYQLCMGEASKNTRTVGPEVQLSYPYFITADTLPEGTQEIWMRAYFRDGTLLEHVVQLTADSSPPVAYVAFPKKVFLSDLYGYPAVKLPFPVSVLVRDDLQATVTLSVPGMPLELVEGVDQISVNTTGSAKPGTLPPQLLPDVSNAVRFDVPVILDATTTPPIITFDGVRDWLYDTDKDGVVDGYFDMVALRDTKLVKADCNGDKLSDLSVDVDKDKKGCGANDLVLERSPCDAAASDPFLVDWDRDGGCDPNGKPKEYLLKLKFIGITLDGFLGKDNGDPGMEAFLQQPGSSRLVVFTPVHATDLGMHDWNVRVADVVGNEFSVTGEFEVIEPNVDAALKSIEVAGREPRYGTLDEGGNFTPGEDFLASKTKKGKSVPPLLLPGDVVRLKATSEYREGEAPLQLLTYINGEQVVRCDDPEKAPDFLVEPPTLLLKPTVTGCTTAQYGPGRHTVTARVLVPAWSLNETDPTNQELQTEFEVYLGMVLFKPRRGDPVEYYIRAGSNGLPLPKGAVYDPKADKAYDANLDGSEYAFNATIKETRGRTTDNRVVELAWDPMARYDVANERLCTGSWEESPPETCRPITCIEEFTTGFGPCGGPKPKPAAVPAKESPGVGALLLLGLAAVAIALRRRRE